ncbi:MAG TPA: type III-B CRISPR-associated protein Cas10/Cmr2 [Desulfobulbaceae bacterium]|nr:type III-B CRISPR-associated protein Cas10/Cmr2 [Desulfobulbaceae bacterium]
MNKYIGITIGPIQETLSLSTSPAALWAGSFIFSWLSRRLCEKIAEKTGAEAIVSPFFNPNNAQRSMEDGVGRFHDRVIVKAEKISIEEVAAIITKVKEEIAGILLQPIKDLPDEKDSNNPPPTDEEIKTWFATYWQIRAVEYAVADNIIGNGSCFLDAIECERIFSSVEKRNYLLDIFEHGPDEATRRENRNKAVKNLGQQQSFNINRKAWQLLDADGSILELREIAAGQTRQTQKKKKKFSYYAVIQSDGDEMSGVFQKCGADPEKLRDQSKKLLNFASEAAKMVKAYGGVTIYAGGDDLLCLAPVENGEGDAVQNLLNLLETLRDTFADFFGKGQGFPTLSFGVAIRYYKHPLYEAFADAGRLLFDKAKIKGGKNAAAISLKKHSGHGAEFILTGFDNNHCLADIQNIIRGHCEEKYLNSVAHHLRNFRVLFREALKKAKEVDDADAPALKNAFANVFDHDTHDEGGTPAQLAAIRHLFFKIRDGVLPMTEPKIDEAANQAERDCRQAIAALDEVLRFARFFNEEAENDD